jgi:hypothetical protein
LPTEFLLGLPPDQVEHPDWQTHIAALAMIGLDPNLAGSQYLQGWALEGGQTVREGPGVAYELLWADPYLPGVSYQNLDPWAYDLNGRLFARTDWSEHACWIGITTAGARSLNCSPDWQHTTQTFGHLKLIPMSQACMQVPARKNNDSVIIWQTQPQQLFVSARKESAGRADGAGMWRVSANVEGKICKSGS